MVGICDGSISVTTVDEAGSVATGIVKRGLLDDIMVSLVSKMVELGITADDSEPVCPACEECIETADV